MKIKILLVATLSCALPVLPISGPLAPSSVLASSDSDLVAPYADLAGVYWNLSNGDRWNLGADGAYTFTGGAAKRRAGTISHSGTYSLSDTQRPGNDDPTKSTLTLRTTRRVVLQNGRRRTVRGTRFLKVPFFTTEADGHININGIHYWLNGVFKG